MKNQDYEDYDQDYEKKEIDIMEKLHKKKMAVIERCFPDKNSKGQGLTIQQFLKVMLEHLDYNKDSKEETKKITLALIELFKEIDVNGDGTMEWVEFSNHIIELGLLRNDRSFKDVIKSYHPAENIKDEQKHETVIDRVYFFDRLKMLLVLEKESPKFKVYNSNTSELIWNVNAHKGYVLSAEFIPDQNLIASSSNDLTINFWDSSSFNLKQILSVPEIQLCMRYARWSSSQSNFLYTGGSDSIIHIYDTYDLKERGTLSGWNPFIKRDSQQYGHSSPIGDILAIDQQNTLVTGGLDGNICLWDSATHQPKKELRGHEKGVYSLDWSDWSPMNQCLISAGLDHEAFVWNTYVKEKIFLLRGHNHPLVGVKCLPRTSQVVTADISGMVKVWDVRNFLQIQTFNVPADEIQAFTLTYPKKQIVVGARKMFFYEYDEPKDQMLTDEKMCLKVLYNQTLTCFITLHPDSVKTWDARTGKLQQVYRELSVAELTTMIIDARQRKLFIGDSEGRIFTVNIKNGAKMKKFERHHKMITDLAHWSNDTNRRVISCSREDTVNIHDEDSQDAHKSCRYKMKQHHLSVNSLHVKQDSENLVSCADDGAIFIIDLVSYRQELVWKCQYELKKVMFLESHNCIVSVDSIGNVYFIGVLESKFKSKLLLQKTYKAISLTNQEETFPVTSINYHDNLLYLGDELGNLKIWNIKQVLDKVDLHQVEQKIKTRKNNDADTFVTAMDYGQEDIAQIFVIGDIMEVGYQRKAHQDGITYIEVCKDGSHFATSSFDCCCYLWAFKNGQVSKIGALILGHDANWGYRIDEISRAEAAEQEANELLEELKDTIIPTKVEKNDGQISSSKQQLLDRLYGSKQQKDQQLQQNQAEKEDKKEMALNRAKNALKIYEQFKQKQFTYQNQQNQNDQDIKKYDDSEYKDVFQQQDYDEEEEDNYNILTDLQEFKQQQLSSGVYSSKNAFKTKLIKGHHKSKFS
ncbi:unnamed protein product [Paramecium primaurelia]|uniref:EF-hand domain-containing protein n=2 Tax=Paramecium TaxID=5884 RepID=A0A8S1Y5I8_9CILI|nr:unnamed protein product [Paramecium primaurelia]CAD8207024.1 unnamed protein product [Paramecium pentaurelia]